MTDHIIFNQESKAAPIKAINQLSPDKKWVISINPVKKRRTNSQNALYWMWVDRIAKSCGDSVGYTKDEMATIFKQKFLAPDEVNYDGEVYAVYSTKGLSKKEMSEYMDHICRFAAEEFGVYVPLPEELQSRG